ncbi:MAG: response regulator [Chitinophagaceae bacterium]|nr:response regulator [Chitinophagaceae bacterium]
MNLHSVEILLAEDNAADAELAIRALKKHNMANNLVHVKDGEEALEFLTGTGRYASRSNGATLPRVVLLDIQMPKVSGIEVLQHIRDTPQTKHLPVVILTSSKESPDIQKCYDLGANSYIVKPVNFESFAEAIRNLGFYWLLLNQPPVKS